MRSWNSSRLWTFGARCWKICARGLECVVKSSPNSETCRRGRNPETQNRKHRNVNDSSNPNFCRLPPPSCLALATHHAVESADLEDILEEGCVRGSPVPLGFQDLGDIVAAD